MMHKKLITFAILALVCLGADAKRKYNKPPFELRRHEFSAGIGGFSTNRLFGDDFSFMKKYGLERVISLTNIYFTASTYSVEMTTPHIELNYFYNFNKHWALGASFSHDSMTRSFYDRTTGHEVSREALNSISPMIYARATWLNRPYVRMYTTYGLGVMLSLKNEVTPKTEVLPATQFNPIGISVGGKLYGFAETGIGTSYFGGIVGIGYRF